MLATIVHWLDGNVPPGGLIVDLGAGTSPLGRDSRCSPEVRAQLVDIDPNMLEVAAARCCARGRCEVRLARFEDQLPRCRAVVASLALTTSPRMPRSASCIGAILEALEPNGLVVVGDALVYPDGPERGRMVEDLVRAYGGQRHLSRGGGAHLARWGDEDFYVSSPTSWR
jgi:hypothetical protein